MAENKDKVISLFAGEPGGEALTDCKKMFLEATKAVLHEKADIQDIFRYGAEGGDQECKESIARFLTGRYGTPVSSNSLVLTAGATQGFHLLLTITMTTSTVVFMEDPSYFMAIPLVTDDLKKTVVPVLKDDEGMKPEELDDLCTLHKPRDWQKTETGPQVWACVYFVPVFNNPTGQTYSDARLNQLVAVARKHDVLLVADDLYHFLSFADGDHISMTSSKSVSQIDKQTDPDYSGGHFVRNCSFSKLLAPGLRVGWIEGPDWLMDRLTQCHVSQGGGCFNHYTFKLVSHILRHNWEREHLRSVKQLYKQRMTAVVQFLKINLPDGCTFHEPEGGFYLWVYLKPDTDAEKLYDFASKKHKVTFMPGALASPSGNFRNYVRLAVSSCDEPELIEGARRFCCAYKDYLDLPSNNPAKST